MKTTKLWGLIVLTLAGVNSALAQSKTDKHERPAFHEMMDSYWEELQLDETQKQQVNSINQTYLTGFNEIKKSESSRIAKLKALRSLNEERDREMKKVLNDEQYQRYQEFQKQMKAELKDKRRKR